MTFSDDGLGELEEIMWGHPPSEDDEQEPADQAQHYDSMPVSGYFRDTSGNLFVFVKPDEEDEFLASQQATLDRKNRQASLEYACKLILAAIGEDPDREGLRETPKRFAKMWLEFIDYKEENYETTFESTEADQVVIVSGMRVWSMCEHHLLPFWADVSIGYLPTGRVLGLSKFGRIAHKFAHSLQLQERLSQEIADEVCRVTESPDVAVLIRGEHTCMTMRGIKTPGVMTTSVMRGVFREEGSARAEFLSLASR
jgi:GTP cyclohydrolase I